MELSQDQMRTLQAAAIAARQRAYAPYSKFLVGAALGLDGGGIITGGNVECASFGLTLCAERSALVHAVDQGVTAAQMRALVVAADAAEMTAPCGACRQVLLELCPPELCIVLVNVRDHSQRTLVLSALLPHAFGPSVLGQRAL